MTKDAQEIHSAYEPHDLLTDLGYEIDPEMKTNSGVIYRIPNVRAEDNRRKAMDQADRLAGITHGQIERDKTAEGDPEYFQSVNAIDEPLKTTARLQDQ
ncbi:MAG: hypothetical protein MUC92_04640 [Fimbriimonadaceae bacterium]|nr:hypothetical protein [Fimbriimonadaceae bacterium]